MLTLKLRPTAVVAAIALASLAAASCKTASYEVVQGKKKVKPTLLQPGSAVTAKVEALRGATVATSFSLNETVTIRPTTDTADLDDVGKSQCVNPGITKITYTISDGRVATVDRPTACEPASISHRFTRAGTFTIRMQVVTNDKETAEATTTVTVGNCVSQTPCGGTTQGVTQGVTQSGGSLPQM